MRQDDDARERIQGYLDRSGLAAGKPRVVPLTGDASDRRYFRILLPGAPSIVLALNSAPFDVTKLPFVNVATLMAKMPVPIPGGAGARGRSRRARAAGSRRRHAAGAPGRREPRGARGAVPPGGRADRDAAAARRGARVARVPALRHLVRRREADVGARLLHEALPRGVPRRDAGRRSARRAARGVRRHRPRARGGAARPLPPRLSQPQPDAARVAALHHRLPGRAHGARHLRPGVAAARLVCRSARADGRAS